MGERIADSRECCPVSVGDRRIAARRALLMLYVDTSVLVALHTPEARSAEDRRFGNSNVW
jgi:hypothetical protein